MKFYNKKECKNFYECIWQIGILIYFFLNFHIHQGQGFFFFFFYETEKVKNVKIFVSSTFFSLKKKKVSQTILWSFSSIPKKDLVLESLLAASYLMLRNVK